MIDGLGMTSSWPRRAALFWTVAYGGFGLVCTLTDTPVYAGGDHRAPAGLDWSVVAIAALAATALRSRRRALLWTACALSAVSAFGLLMNVITLVFEQKVDDPVAAASEALAALGVGLLAAMARSGRPSGRAVGPPAPSPAPRSARWAAYTGALAFVPYAAMKTTWAVGGTFAGTSGAEMRAIAERNGASGLWLTLESWGIDATALLAALGIFLLFGLVRPWGQVFPRWTLVLHGRRVPRWLPLTPAVLGSATLAPYGVAGIGYVALATAGAVTIPRGDFHTSADALLVSWIGLSAFGVYGIALIVAARSYWLRTRPTRQP
jgi:hypothetical protein